MGAILTTVLPVFSLIILGFVLAKINVIDVAAARGISLFVFNVAIPALLFRTTATMDFHNVAPWSLWGVFFGGMAVTWVLTALIAPRFESLDFNGGATASMAAGFGNLAMLGTPLSLQHFGPQVAVPLGLILSIHAPVLWTVATIHRELARHAGGLNWQALVKELARNLARNAIVISLIAGAIWRAFSLPMPAVPDKVLAMLADASIPTALCALGASLAGYHLKGAFSGMAALIAMKMLCFPLAVFILSRSLFSLPPLYAQIALLFSAMPTGANAFLFAQRNDEAVPAVSGAITLGTALAAISVSVLLYAFDSGWI